jgi:hypothetical protein
MGFYFKKSINLGPIRINFSKSGIGISFGVKGCRISMGPKGTKLNAGAKGLYYSKTLSSAKGKTSGKSKITKTTKSSQKEQ